MFPIPYSSWDWNNLLHIYLKIFSRYVFGMSQDTFRQVLILVGEELDCHRPENPTALRPPQKLAIFLDFARTNGYHRSVSRASFNQICQAQATRVINYVARAIAALHVQVLLVIFLSEAN